MVVDDDLTPDENCATLKVQKKSNKVKVPNIHIFFFVPREVVQSLSAVSY